MPRAKKHHNNKSFRTIKNGNTAPPLQRLAARLKVPFKVGRPSSKPYKSWIHEGSEHTND